jgi:hypothetical protein
MPETFNRDISQLDLVWLPRAAQHAESLGLSPRSAERAAKYPDHVAVDPSSKILDDRWYAERRRKGDITVVVAFPPGAPPMIWGVYYNLPLEPPKRLRKSAGQSGGGKYATTNREFRRRIMESGLVIKSGGKHDRVETPEGRLISVLPVTPSDHRWIVNATRELARQGFDLTR